MKWMAKLEHKIGKYAVPHLTLVLIGCYVVGYALQLIGHYSSASVSEFLTLNPYAIVHGQVWRLVSWILIPPDESNFIFALIMLFFYFSIGSTLERAWGDFQYNVYLFSGMIFTILGSFLIMGFTYLTQPNLIMAFSIRYAEQGDYQLFQTISNFFTTYYVNMSIFLAYAATFPDNRVLLMFIIPIKVKILGFIYGGFILYEMVSNIFILNQYNLGFVPPFVIGASLLNFLLFFLTTRNYIRKSGMRTRAQHAYHKQVREFQRNERAYRAGVITKHKCAVCGRTERDGDQLVFRFCSKCDGNYEFCQDHLYTHIHFTGSDPTKPGQSESIYRSASQGSESVYHGKDDKPEGFY